MTVPDENRPKTGKTDDTSVAKPDEERRSQQKQENQGARRSMREALDEADITPEDYEEE
jgi:3-oxoacyl-(acyl-carrier-protein) synthase